MSNRGYSPDCHVDLYAVQLKKVCKGGGEGGGEVTGSTRPFSPSQRLCYPIETGHLWFYSLEKLGIRKSQVNFVRIFKKNANRLFCSPNLSIVRNFD